MNQIPVASGLLSRCEERHVSIDLGKKVDKAWYELIELKAGENAETPLRAAFQILCYGLLYCFARLHCDKVDVPYKTGVLAANRIDLKVLDPRSIYLGYSLGWLAGNWNRALQASARRDFDLVWRFIFVMKRSLRSFDGQGPTQTTCPGSSNFDLPIHGLFTQTSPGPLHEHVCG